MLISQKFGKFLFLISMIQIIPLFLLVLGIEIIILRIASLIMKRDMTIGYAGMYALPFIRFFLQISFKLAGVNFNVKLSVILIRRK